MTTRAASRSWAASLIFVSFACSSTDPSSDDDSNPTPENNSEVFGHCTYNSPFTQQEECREYRGSGWTADVAAADCNGQGGVVTSGACDYPEFLGACALPRDEDTAVFVITPGADTSLCSEQQAGCELFARGVFTPSSLCEEGNSGPPPGVISGASIPPVLSCQDPMAGEAPGVGPDEQVCTWVAIGGSTEAGRRFQDYASCDAVRTQRPYYPAPAADPPSTPDNRMDDPTYAAEVAWVKSQVEASACVCCHASSLTPVGASNWDIEAEGNWINTFGPDGLAFAGGFVDSTLLGFFPPEDNNGFARELTGIPSTDPARMRSFFEAEMLYRGVNPDDYANTLPLPEFLYQQLTFEPSACEGGEGIDESQMIHWNGGGARYVYVLETDSENPGPPPNFDRPDGMLWRVDVPPEGAPLNSGTVRYGAVPIDMQQSFPAEGEPTTLVTGDSYYLYVLTDVGVPVTRCVFTYPRAP